MFGRLKVSLLQTLGSTNDSRLMILKALLAQAIDVIGYGFQVTADACVIRLGSRIAEAVSGRRWQRRKVRQECRGRIQAAVCEIGLVDWKRLIVRWAFRNREE